MNITNLRDGKIPQEKIHEKEVSDEQDDAMQEPTSLNIPVEIATNPRIEEPKDEVISDFMDEDCTMTPEPSHDIEIIEMELQHQNNDQVKQDAVTQEPTSFNVLVQVAIQMREEEAGTEGTLEFDE